MKKERLYYIDVLRVIATIMVIGIHVSASYMYNLNGLNFVIGYSVNSVSRVCIGLFLMITGSVWLSRGSENYINSKKFYNISLKLFILFIIWNLGYSLRIGENDLSFKFGCAYHLWYLVLASVMYALIPTISYLSYKMRVELFRVCFIFGIVMYSLGNLFNSSRSMSVVFGEVLGYLGYVIVGYLLNSEEREYTGKTRAVFVGIYVLICSVRTAIGVFISRDIGDVSEKYFGYNFIGVFLECVLLFLIFKGIKFKRQSKVVMFISRYSFGIYLFHLSVIFVLNYIKALDKIPMFVGIVIVFGASAIMSFICNKLPFFKWFVRT